jgi:hypothetical protein
MARDTLILQFDTSGAVADLDWLIHIEHILIQGFSQNGSAHVDGHDFGSGKMSIYLFPTRGWTAAIEIVKAYLSRHGALDRGLIIKRLKSGRYKVVWPENYTGDFERL